MSSSHAPRNRHKFRIFGFFAGTRCAEAVALDPSGGVTPLSNSSPRAIPYLPVKVAT